MRNVDWLLSPSQVTHSILIGMSKRWDGRPRESLGENSLKNTMNEGQFLSSNSIHSQTLDRQTDEPQTLAIDQGNN